MSDMISLTLALLRINDGQVEAHDILVEVN